jgi:hypothetical protein
MSLIAHHHLAALTQVSPSNAAPPERHATPLPFASIPPSFAATTTRRSLLAIDMDWIVHMRLLQSDD